MSAYYVVSTAVGSVQSQSIRAGRRFAPAPQRLPDGTWHAVTLDSPEMTACGLNAVFLHHWEDWPWDRPSFEDRKRCPECVELSGYDGMNPER